MPIHISAKMIEAGVEALSEFEQWINLGPTGAENLVSKILLAALTEVSSENGSSPSEMRP